MENISSNKISNDTKLNKENNIDNSFINNQKLLPVNISLIKNIFTIPQYKDKNIIYINDIETLNDSSSLTNNLEEGSIKYNQNDSLTLSQSNENRKVKSNKNKNTNHSDYLKRELITKENENLILKKEIFKLREEINSNKIKLLKLQQYEQDFEKIINDMKKDFRAKEKANNKIIEKLKNEIKIKDHILNSFQETIIVKNQMIERFKVQLKKKDNQINELNRKIRKNLEINYSNSNIFFKRKSSNSSYKENKIKNRKLQKKK